MDRTNAFVSRAINVLVVPRGHRVLISMSASHRTPVIQLPQLVSTLKALMNAYAKKDLRNPDPTLTNALTSTSAYCQSNILVMTIQQPVETSLGVIRVSVKKDTKTLTTTPESAVISTSAWKSITKTAFVITRLDHSTQHV